MRILTSVGHYLPGYKSGGPIRTIANLVDRLGDEFQFKIVTADRDSGDEKPYRNIKVADWNRVGRAMVFYIPLKKRSLRCFRRLLCSTDYDILYLNSFFSPHFTIKLLLLRKLRLILDRPLVIAPRGEFSPGALGLKSFKKRVYMTVAKALGLYKDIIWQASSEHEELYIRRWFGRNARVMVAPNLPPPLNTADEPAVVSDKTKGCLKIVFLSRISRMKNLDGALKMLNGLKGKIQFSIYGPMEDKTYWAECQKIISSLSENIEVLYCGSVEHDKTSAVMREHDLLFLPTLGENFGHVILEALCTGCPVLISDQTPWRGLEEKGIGWDLALNKPEMFQDVLQQCVDMNNEEYVKWSERAWEYGLQVTKDDKVVEQNRRLFYKVASM
ncbi:MAG: glycosyltransferase [Deltaproteobacteria bacterium]|nr:glycosyltransferase [Deltaproteobacteria bacterium]